MPCSNCKYYKDGCSDKEDNLITWVCAAPLPNWVDTIDYKKSVRRCGEDISTSCACFEENQN